MNMYGGAGKHGTQRMRVLAIETRLCKTEALNNIRGKVMNGSYKVWMLDR